MADTPLSQFESQLAVHALGPIGLVQALLPDLRGGHTLITSHPQMTDLGGWDASIALLTIYEGTAMTIDEGIVAFLGRRAPEWSGR